MYTHLVTLVSFLYGTDANIDLIKSQRCGYIQGYRTLSDIIINDNYFDNLLYKVEYYDLLYKDNVNWGDEYIPTLSDQSIIYFLCKDWFRYGPVPRIYPPYDIPLMLLDTISANSYVKACVAAVGALRVLQGWSTLEIGLLCEDILLLIGRTLLREIVTLPEDKEDYIRANRRSMILKKFRK